MVVELVPVKGGIGSIWGPPEDFIKWHFSCQLRDGLCHRSHLSREPETTIEKMVKLLFRVVVDWALKIKAAKPWFHHQYLDPPY